MTPFCEDLVEIAPAMDGFFKEAKFFDLNHKSEQIHASVEAFYHGEKGFYGVMLEDGAYWFEVTGFDLRTRFGYAAVIDGKELTANMVVQDSDGLVALDGIIWAVLSKMSPIARVMSIEGAPCNIHPAHPIMLLSAIEMVTA